MYAVTVTFRIEPGQMDTFLSHMMVNAGASLRDEPGCHQFDVCTDPDLPDEVFLYELYTDRAAFDAHTRMPHYQVMNAAAEGLVADKVVRVFADVRQ